MHNAMLAKKRQAAEDLDGETPNEGRREASKAIRLDKLVEVDAEKLGDDAEVAAEREGLDHPYDMVFLLGVLRRRSSASVCSRA